MRTRSSSARCAPRSGGATAASPASTRSTCRRTCCARSPSAPASTRRDVDDVVWGCVSQVGEQSWNVGRNAVLAAGWPESVPGTTLDRQCGSSQQAVHFAAAAVLSGQADLVVAGGVESMTPGADGLQRRRRRAVRTAGARALPRRRRVRRGRSGAVQPGRRRRDDRRAVGLLPGPARRVRAGQPRSGGRGAGRRRVRRGDRAGAGGDGIKTAGRGHPPGHLAGEARPS